MKDLPDANAKISAEPGIEHRKNDAHQLMLVEVEPFEVVDCLPVEHGYLACDVVSAGAVRETCPACEEVHLQLVLLQPHVAREHLFCEKCTRCFDASEQGGKSVFA
jgi:hypothetical protein